MQLERSNEVSQNLLNAHEMYPLINLVDIIYVRLKSIRSQSPNGSILNEIIERTEIIAYNMRSNERSVLSSDLIRSFHKNLWQQLTELDRADVRDNLPSTLEEQKRIFFYLFKDMDKIVQNLVSDSSCTQKNGNLFRTIRSVKLDSNLQECFEKTGILVNAKAE